MAIKAAGQMTLIDLTDGYSVVLTNESHTFLGSTSSVSSTQTTSCMVQALCGTEVIPCSVGTITCPTGLSIVSDGKIPTPTLTITATTALKTNGTVMIPVQIGDITISKAFSYSIAFRGSNGSNGTSVTVSSTTVTYNQSDSGTTPPTDGWVSTPPAPVAGKYSWTKTVIAFSDGKKAESHTVSRNGSNGSNGTSVTVTSNQVTYQAGDSGTAAPTGTWTTSVPSVAAGKYLWTRTIVTYSDGKTTTAYSVSRQGANGTNGTNGTNGKDALTLIIISSNGTIFKNTDIATTLTAHVYKGGVEVTGSSLTALGTIKWYKDDSTTATATGTTLTIQAGDILNQANFTAQLEG